MLPHVIDAAATSHTVDMRTHMLRRVIWAMLLLRVMLQR